MSVADTTTAAKYDDPYEENPIVAKCLLNGIAHDTAEVTESVAADMEPACDASVTGVSTQTEMSQQSSAVSVAPVRSFELSAEYGGFFVVPAANEQSCDKDTEADRDKPGRVDSAAGVTGLYDEPWDLSTVQRSIEDRLCENSQSDVGRTVANSCISTMTDVYAQPQKRHHGRAGNSASDAWSSDGPSYGVLCERLSSNMFVSPPPLARRRAGVNSKPATGMWTMDSRPLDDYDIPWDQKKKVVSQPGNLYSF